MRDASVPIEHQPVRDATLYDFAVIKTEIVPTVANDDFAVRLEMQLEQEGVEHCAIPVIFTLAALSFHDGRPRGGSFDWFEDDDQFTVIDFLRYLRFEHGRLHVYVDYLRGRCIKTRIEVDAGGKVLLETVNRGQAATRWVDRLRGKESLRVVAARED